MMDDGDEQTGGGAEPSTPEGQKRKRQEVKPWRQEGAETRHWPESHHSCQLTALRAEPHLPAQKPHSGPEIAAGSESSCRPENASALKRLNL